MTRGGESPPRNQLRHTRTKNSNEIKGFGSSRKLVTESLGAGQRARSFRVRSPTLELHNNLVENRLLALPAFNPASSGEGAEVYWYKPVRLCCLVANPLTQPLGSGGCRRQARRMPTGCHPLCHPGPTARTAVIVEMVQALNTACVIRLSCRATFGAAELKSGTLSANS